jgi:hypothetical protein
MTSPREELLETLSNVAPPLHAQLANIDLRLDEAVKQVEELRATKNDLLKVLRVIDPDGVPSEKKKRGPQMRVSEERVEAIGEWLRANMNGAEISAQDLREREGFEVLRDQRSIQVALDTLADRGLLRLDRVGKGNRRFYRMVGQ